MNPISFEALNNPAFLKQSYADFIKVHILNQPQMTEDELVDAIYRAEPTLDPEQLRKHLQATIRCNAGITPCLLKENHQLAFIAGHSQRQGRGARGVLVSATGLVEPEDKTLMSSALRELHEELGYPLYAACQTQTQQAIAEIHSGLGDNLQQVAANLAAFIKGEKRSISIHTNILIPLGGDAAEQATLIAASNAYLQGLHAAYQPAVKIRYEHEKNTPYTQDDYDAIIKATAEILPWLKSPLLEQVQGQYDLLMQEQSEKHLTDLAKILIEITENDQIVTVAGAELKRLLDESQKHPEKPHIEGFDTQNKTWSFFQPALASLAHLPENLPDLARDQQHEGIARPFIALYQGLFKLYNSGIELAFRIIPVSRRLFRSIKYYQRGEAIQFKKHQIMEELLYASLFNFPHSIGLEGLSGIALGALYEDFAKKPGSRLPRDIIPSHVNAAETWNPINFVQIPVGTILYKYLRPKGWLGEYATINRAFKPSELGIADQISNPDKPEELMDRIHAELAVIAPLPSQAAMSTASAVKDFWSQVGREVWCEGGGTQLYMPMTAADKTRCLAIIKPEPGDFNYHQLAQIEEIAKQNNVQFLTRKEIEARNITLKPLNTEFAEIDAAPEALLAMAYQAYHSGEFQIAIKALSTYLSKSGLTEYQVLSASVLLGSLYVQTGHYQQAQLHLQNFIATEKGLDDKTPMHQYLILMGMIHLSRAQIVPEHAINQLNECLQFMKTHQTNPEIAQRSRALRQLIHLEFGLAYNKLARQVSICQDYDDFDDVGDPVKDKHEQATNALKYLTQVDEKLLPPLERLICLLEKASALTQRHLSTEALIELARAKDLLIECQNGFDEAIQKEGYKNLKLELNLLSASIDMGIGINLSRARKYKKPVPTVFSELDPVEHIKTLETRLDGFISVEVSTLFKRWVGPNANNLFVEGWHYTANDEKNPDKGGNLLALYRKYIPLDLPAICEKLRDNQLTELNLAFLGLAPPAGINDDDFGKLCAALAQNTSLKKLFLRKCCDKMTLAEGQTGRLEQLFTALKTAQSHGQALQYLSYSGARFSSRGDYTQCMDFLAANKSLRVLDLSWYDWSNTEDLARLATILGKHPSLRTLSNGINNHRGAGLAFCTAFYEAWYEKKTLKHICTYDGVLDKTKQPNAVINRNWMLILKDELKGDEAVATQHLMARL